MTGMTDVSVTDSSERNAESTEANSSDSEDDFDVILYKESVDVVERNLQQPFLSWNPDADKRASPAVYSGDSQRTKRRKRAESAKNARENRNIMEMFGLQRQQALIPSITATLRMSEKEEEFLRMKQAIDILKEFDNPRNDTNHSLTKLQQNRLCSIRRYMINVVELGQGKMEASLAVARNIWGKTAGKRFATRIRQWADVYLETSDLPGLKQGAHQKTSAFISDDGHVQSAKAFLRSLKPEKRTPLALKDWLEEGLLTEIFPDGKATISVSTCERYMNAWAFRSRQATGQNVRRWTRTGRCGSIPTGMEPQNASISEKNARI